jgi:hypothetical protein
LLDSLSGSIPTQLLVKLSTTGIKNFVTIFQNISIFQVSRYESFSLASFISRTTKNYIFSIALIFFVRHKMSSVKHRWKFIFRLESGKRNKIRYSIFIIDLGNGCVPGSKKYFATNSELYFVSQV